MMQASSAKCKDEVKSMEASKRQIEL